MDQKRRRKQARALALASGIIAAAVAIQLLLPHLLPHGPAVDVPPRHRPATSVVDPANASLRLSGGKLTKIYERFEGGQRDPLLSGPETIIFDGKGTMYVMNENAKLVSLSDLRRGEGGADDSVLTARATEVADLGPGRPLGGKFDREGRCLYYADVALGLARICDPTSLGSNVELLASRVKLEDGSWSPIRYADDVDIGPRTGHVYFSDASDVRSDRDVSGKWDVLYPSKVEGLRGRRTGRLLRYRPEAGEVDVLATGAAFANGVAVDEQETFILYTSTFEATVMKYRLSGEGGGPERLLDRFPGFLDGADCSFRSGLCYVAIPSTVPPLVSLIFSLPPWISAPIRSLLLMIPRTWTPKPVPYGAVAEIILGDGDEPARIRRVIQDPDGRDMSMVTGVTEHEGKLYLGSLHNNFVGVVSLD